jgi:hypothetical protein
MIGYTGDSANDILLHLNIWFGIELLNLSLLSYSTQASDQKWNNNQATNKSYQNMEDNSREGL